MPLFDDKAYAARSRSQRIDYWRRRLEAAAAALRPVRLRQLALLDLWRTLNRLEPRFSAVPAELLDLYFDLRDRLESGRADLSPVPGRRDSATDAVPMPPPDLEPGDARWLAAFEHARRLDAADPAPTRSPPVTTPAVVEAGAGSRRADDRLSLAELIALLEQGYLNTYGPAVDPTVEPAAGSPRLPRREGRRDHPPSIDPTTEPASRSSAGLVSGAARALDQALRRWLAVPAQSGERPGATAAAAPARPVESPGRTAARPVPSSVLWLRHWLRQAAAAEQR